MKGSCEPLYLGPDRLVMYLYCTCVFHIFYYHHCTCACVLYTFFYHQVLKILKDSLGERLDVEMFVLDFEKGT